MNDCGNCMRTNHLGLPDFSTMPCAVCARYGEDNDPTMWKAKPQTNYERLISKTPEQLAKTIVGWLADAAELCGENRQEFDLTKAEEYTVSWLKAPAEEGE